MAKANVKKKIQFWGTGRRKKAIARVRLIPGGNGTIVINDRAFEDYFPQGTLQYIVKQPLVAVEAEAKYDVMVNVIGGGYTGQAGAIRLGVRHIGFHNYVTPLFRVYFSIFSCKRFTVRPFS